MTCEYFAAMKRMEENYATQTVRLEMDGVRPQPDMAKFFFEGLMECLVENQRKMTKFFEDEM